MENEKIYKLLQILSPILPIGIPNDHHQVEEHVEFLMEYFASFGTTMVPNMGIHKKILSILAKRYNLFDKKQQIKDFGVILVSKKVCE